MRCVDTWIGLGLSLSVMMVAFVSDGSVHPVRAQDQSPDAASQSSQSVPIAAENSDIRPGEDEAHRQLRAVADSERLKRKTVEAKLEAALLRAQQAEARVVAAEQAMRNVKATVGKVEIIKPTEVISPANAAGAEEAVPQAVTVAPSPEGIPPHWAEEERIRLELEDRLKSASSEGAQAGAPAQKPQKTPAVTSAVGQTITLRLKGSRFEISGILKKIDKVSYVIQPPNSGDITVPVERFDCVGEVCPPSAK